MKMFSLVWLMLLSHSILVSSENHPSCNDNNVSQSNKSIFILAGQSNMAGRGGVIDNEWDGKTPPESQSNPLILRLNSNLTWVLAEEPLHKDIDEKKTCGIGPGMAFANSVLKRDSSIGVIGLVPCAIGGTSIRQWSKGGDNYNRMLSRAQAALRDGGRIRAILWYQGESDTVDLKDAESYKGRAEKFFTDIRCDLQLPNLPIIQVILASADQGGQYLDKVRKAQMDIKLPNLRNIDALGMKLKTDHVHLSTEAEVEVGQRLADAFLQFEVSPLV